MSNSFSVAKAAKRARSLHFIQMISVLLRPSATWGSNIPNLAEIHTNTLLLLDRSVLNGFVYLMHILGSSLCDLLLHFRDSYVFWRDRALSRAYDLASSIISVSISPSSSHLIVKILWTKKINSWMKFSGELVVLLMLLPFFVLLAFQLSPGLKLVGRACRVFALQSNPQPPAVILEFRNFRTS